MMRLRKAGLAIPLVAAALVAAACGSSGGGGGGDSTNSPAPGPTGDTGNTNKSITLAFSAAAPQVEKIPTIQAMDALKAAGYDVKINYFSKPTDAVQAVAQGDADIGSASETAVYAAANQGIPVKAIFEANGPSYAMAAPVSVTSPEGLNGLKVGIHAKVSSTTLYTDLLLEKYPNVKPKILVVPGSANRINAMAAGQLDASVVQLADLPALEKLAPGKFHVIYNYALERPDIMDALIFTTSKKIQSDPKLLQTIIDAIAKAQQAAYTDTAALEAAIEKYVPKVTAEEAKENAKDYTEAKVWRPETGFTETSVKTTVDAAVKAELLDKAPDMASANDFTFAKAIPAS